MTISGREPQINESGLSGYEPMLGGALDDGRAIKSADLALDSYRNCVLYITMIDGEEIVKRLSRLDLVLYGDDVSATQRTREFYNFAERALRKAMQQGIASSEIGLPSKVRL